MAEVPVFRWFQREMNYMEKALVLVFLLRFKLYHATLLNQVFIGGRSPIHVFPSADSPSNLAFTSLKSDPELPRMAGRSRSGVVSPAAPVQGRRPSPLPPDFKFPPAPPPPIEPMAEEVPAS